MSKAHIWSYPDVSGVKHCLYDGCAVRVRRAYAEWQRRKSAHWVSILAADIPACSGEAPPFTP
jgi:hypothetical protein